MRCTRWCLYGENRIPIFKFSFCWFFALHVHIENFWIFPSYFLSSYYLNVSQNSLVFTLIFVCFSPWDGGSSRNGSFWTDPMIFYIVMDVAVLHSTLNWFYAFSPTRFCGIGISFIYSNHFCNNLLLYDNINRHGW
jgi:hypothetical protein